MSASVLAVAAGALGAASVTAPPAAALTPPVGFTADALSTCQTNGIVRALAEADGVVYAGGTLTGIRPAGSPAGSNTTSAVNFAAFDAATGAPAGLASRGTTAHLGSLRFTLPPAPAGQVLRSARLTFRTSSDSTAGSADSHSIVPVTGTWTESAVTHNTRPALSTSVLGTITGAASVSTGYSAELNASALDGALGSVFSLALTSSGTDGLRIWPSEATAACRPQLVLTFGDE
ncbi:MULTISPECIES: DNRLRE domain-containing protein [unclassified Streptomyces]|uniref:DNRLRE domain-containing protein n=1 Tax=unclassified Streptomyces TaxID=2593676 RepID=UPI0004CC2583|nr:MULTISPECIES: DNRLRE domain-containing protein [unclassified Streptomyces]KPC78453.1 hypothetical protein ADK82_30990 [Streptomyces sp. NRRL S-4]